MEEHKIHIKDWGWPEFSILCVGTKTVTVLDNFPDYDDILLEDY